MTGLTLGMTVFGGGQRSHSSTYQKNLSEDQPKLLIFSMDVRPDGLRVAVSAGLGRGQEKCKRAAILAIAALLLDYEERVLCS